MAAETKKPKSLAKVALAGGWAGSMEILVTYPLEFAKTNLQLQHGAAATKSGFDRGVVHCLRSTVERHGLRGVYAGCTSWFVFAGPRSAVRFAAFERLSRDAPRTSFWDFLCGLGAGVFEAALCQTPNQSIQIKLQHDAAPAVAVKRYSHLPFPSACAEIARQHGVLAFYDGVFPAIVKGALTNSIRFVGYHGILRAAGLSGDGDAAAASRPTPVQSMLAGGVAGAVSAVASQPVDTVKANMMGLDRARYASSFACAAAIVKADGAAALFNGLRPRVVRVFFEVGLQFALFEQCAKAVDGLW